ncbi:MAG: RNA polymerase sigma factor [Planctomycetaceae bacterium]|nr:RNA polymerase sigma factor [Planctomycetaceae bacterium]
MEETHDFETTHRSVVPPDVVREEADLIELAKAQPQAFGQLYEIYYDKILNYVYRRTLDVALAEDLTSNTFFHAWRALPDYDHRGTFGAWLYVIAGNEVKQHWRSRRIHCSGDDRCRKDFARLRFSDDPTTIAEEVEEKMMRFARLHDVIVRLPERYQTALSLRYFEGLSYDEIADVLGKKIGTVKSLLYRGLARLKRQLDENKATFPQDLHCSIQEERDQ